MLAESNQAYNTLQPGKFASAFLPSPTRVKQPHFLRQEKFNTEKYFPKHTIRS
jgi:hypothetical protein